MKYKSILFHLLTVHNWKSVIGYCVINIHDIEPTILAKYFLNLLFLCNFYSPQTKRHLVCSVINFAHELPHELPNEVRLRIL